MILDVESVKAPPDQFSGLLARASSSEILFSNRSEPSSSSQADSVSAPDMMDQGLKTHEN
jgi:hypothetical protein